MDFYGILGIGPDASTADIKRAYRRLARQYHPGINPGDRTAQEYFARISEAYETLVDPRRRQEYDASGARAPQTEEVRTFEFTEFDFSVKAHGAQAATFSELFADVLHPLPSAGTPRREDGADLHAVLAVAFVDALRGVERQVVVTRHVACARCSGIGRLVTPEGRCSLCQGSGKTRWARGHMVFSKTCAACAGTGRQRYESCAACAGHGRSVRSDAVAVHVPAGTVNGATLRVPERGHAGRHGGRNGDLYVTVQVQPHPVFHRDGDDLVCDLPLAVHEAVLGARIEVPTLEGPLRVPIPPGTQGGQQLRMSGRGVYTGRTRGDLVFHVRVVVPAVSDDRSRALVRELGALYHDDVRGEIRRMLNAE